jgi:hypothetical protein
MDEAQFEFFVVLRRFAALSTPHEAERTRGDLCVTMSFNLPHEAQQQYKNILWLGGIKETSFVLEYDYPLSKKRESLNFSGNLDVLNGGRNEDAKGGLRQALDKYVFSREESLVRLTRRSEAEPQWMTENGESHSAPNKPYKPHALQIACQPTTYQSGFISNSPAHALQYQKPVEAS